MTRRTQAVDIGMVAVLLATILSILDTSFAGRTYLWVGLLPLLPLAGLAIRCAGHPLGGWIFWIVALLLYPVIGALAALREPGPYLVPSAASMGHLLGSTWTGPVELVSTLPPVDPQSALLVVPFAIGYSAGATALWLALSSRRPLLPQVPLALALVATILVGTLVPQHLVVRGVVLSVLSLTWAALRARWLSEAASGVRSTAPAGVAPLILVTLVSALVLPIVPDNDETDRVLLRGGDMVEALPRSVSSPLGVEHRQGDPAAVLLKVKGLPEGYPVRFAALDTFDGSNWTWAPPASGDGPVGFQRIGSVISPLNDGVDVQVRFRIRDGYQGDWLPTVGELTGLDLDSTDGRTRLEQVRYNQATTTAVVLGGVDPRDRYTLSAVVPRNPELVESDLPHEATQSQRQAAGAYLDEVLQPFARSGLPPMAQLRLLMAYLHRTANVALTVEDEGSPTRMRGLVSGSRHVGTRHEFTALVALSACRLGVPARLVVGAMPTAGGLVMAGNVTDWVEVRVADGSWRAIPDGEYLGGQGQAGAAAGPRSAQFVASQVQRREWQLTRLPKGSLGGPDADDASGSSGPLGTALGLVGSLVLLVVVLWLLVPVIKWGRRVRRSRAAGATMIYVHGWQEVLDTARDRGVPVPLHLSRVVQAERIGVGTDLARAADEAVFAPREPDRTSGQRYWQRAQELRRELLGALPWYRRLRIHFSVASLLTGRGPG